MYYGTLTFFYIRHIILAERKNNSCLNLVSDYPILMSIASPFSFHLGVQLVTKSLLIS